MLIERSKRCFKLRGIGRSFGQWPAASRGAGREPGQGKRPRRRPAPGPPPPRARPHRGASRRRHRNGPAGRGGPVEPGPFQPTVPAKHGAAAAPVRAVPTNRPGATARGRQPIVAGRDRLRARLPEPSSFHDDVPQARWYHAGHLSRHDQPRRSPLPPPSQCEDAGRAQRKNERPCCSIGIIAESAGRSGSIVDDARQANVTAPQCLAAV